MNARLAGGIQASKQVVAEAGEKTSKRADKRRMDELTGRQAGGSKVVVVGNKRLHQFSDPMQLLLFLIMLFNC